MTKMQTSAAQAVALMDLTTLNDSDTTETINNLVASIETTYGIRAAICEYS